MYENKYKNNKESTQVALEQLLLLLADLNQPIELFALGGTAMILANIKETTKDIDFLTTVPYQEMRKLLKKAQLTEKASSKMCNVWYWDDTRIDIFYDAYILGVQLDDDFKEKSIHYKTVGKVSVYILNWYDVIITKIARSEKRDYDDIYAICKKQNVDFQLLKQRYEEEIEIHADKELHWELFEKWYQQNL